MVKKIEDEIINIEDLEVTEKIIQATGALRQDQYQDFWADLIGQGKETFSSFIGQIAKNAGYDLGDKYSIEFRIPVKKD